MGGRVKKKGDTTKSLYGETGKPIQGTIIKVMSKDPGFDHGATQQMSYRVLYRNIEGELMMSWFNTYKQTKLDFEITKEYLGDGQNLERNAHPILDEATFDAGCTKGKYVTLVPIEKYPPQCLAD